MNDKTSKSISLLKPTIIINN